MGFGLSRLMIAFTFALGGCATLDRGIADDVPIVTDPPGAVASSSSGTICTTPCSVSAPRRQSLSVVISKPGYVAQTVSSQAKPMQRAIAAASSTEVTPDVLGRIIDVQDGTYYTHVPPAFTVKLVPVK